jgi:Ni/Co efflux regulator RcnB
MRKLILLAAAAALIVPSAAMAQRHDRTHHDRTTVSRDHRTTRANRQTIRSDRRVVRADQRATRANRQVARSNRRARSAYIAPVHNWSYRPVSNGYRLQSVFYSPRYYISDYGTYGLQAPIHPWLRWIRYGDDLLLVNIRTGRVLDVVHYRYW